jgi:protein involved in polysaccharide export with SLBB domain
MTTPAIDYTSAQNALDRELVRFEGLRTLRDAVQIAGGFQQTADESAKRLEATLAAETEAQNRLEALSLRVADAQAQADIDIARAHAAGDTELTKARVAASAILEKAKLEAAQIVSDAKSQTADSVRRAAVLADAIKAVGS